MIWLLKFLITGHVHKWVKYDEGKISVTDKFTDRKRVTGSAVFCSCEKCGEHRVFRLLAVDD
jgi:hypothetical protein